jgi:hypothetical protein
MEINVDGRQPSVRLRLIGAYAVSQSLVLALLLGPLAGQPWWQGFRGYFFNDQLSYAAIASNVSVGDMRLVEPFTLTGTLYYPSLWYQTMGLLARATGLPVYLMWTLMGVVAVCIAVGVVGWAGYRFSGRAYAPLIPALALLTGTISTPTSGNWYSPLGSHAVVWGPFGSLFTLNAEIAGLCLAAIAMSLALLATRSPRNRPALVVSAAALIGLLANIQTYSFFTTILLVTLFAAVWSLMQVRSPVLTAITVILLLAVLLGGSYVAKATGPLPMFVLLLLALVPAIIPAVRRHRGLFLSAAGVLAIAAAPQVVRTAVGLAGGDAFLTYRQASSQDLGVPVANAIFGAIPLILIGAVCAIAAWRRRESAIAAVLIALATGAAIMSTNDRWGFDQEPYRFWLQYEILAALMLSITFSWAIAQWPTFGIRRKMAFASVGVAAAMVWAVSLADVAGFWIYARGEGVISAQDDRAVAVREVLRTHDGLVMSSDCLDPRVLKMISPGAVAYYNYGLAWPAAEPAFRIFKDAERRASEDPAALQAAGVDYVLTDSACTSDWDFTREPRVRPERTQNYDSSTGPQTLTLWRVAPA